MKGEMTDVPDLPRGWQELLTGMPGARLFRIAPLNGGDTEWRAEMIINGVVQRGRCTSELRARAWLAVWDKSSFYTQRVLTRKNLTGHRGLR